MKLGARIFKTGIAIVLSLYLAQLLHSPSPVLAGDCCHLCDSADDLSVRI